MEEKKYHFEEQEGEGMVCEPAPAYRTVVAEPMGYQTSVSDEDGYDSDSVPLGRSLEEVREHCSHFEEERNDPSQWMTVEEFNQQIHQRHPWWKL